MTTYDVGDVVLVDFPQSGTGTRKRRPALVLLDIGDADVALVPITTRERTGPGDVKIEGWQESGLLRESWVRLAKVACMEKRSVTRRLGCLSEADRTRILQTWRLLFERLP
ncbi:MAG: type II toxin-antitoxin system PemK/MazF family toxin [Nitrospirae bacterium]|nr:type II toxin-antitoxin system PemK/MazF family toxin [Nitrospirota bacterium]